jgi:hypothetical protein
MSLADWPDTDLGFISSANSAIPRETSLEVPIIEVSELKTANYLKGMIIERRNDL